MSTPHFDLIIRQGADENFTVNWYGGGVFRAPIEEIDSGYPTQIKVTSHLLPSASDTPIIISGVEGMTVLNSKDTGIEMCTRVDEDFFTVPVSTVSQEWCVGTGEITWHQPTNITGFTARCQIRKRWHDTALIIPELNTGNGGIVLNDNDASIKLVLTSAQTAAMTADKMVFDVELIDLAAKVIPVFKGTFRLQREQTR
jgi:hypothetical protein